MKYTRENRGFSRSAKTNERDKKNRKAEKKNKQTDTFKNYTYLDIHE